MSTIFKKVANDQNTSTTRDRAASRLTPPGDTHYTVDVINEFPWTLTPANSLALKETPYITLKEFYLLDGALNQLLKSYQQGPIDSSSLLTATGSLAPTLLNPQSLIGEAATSNRVYENMYDHTTPTKFTYKFPYFDNPTITQNNWAARSSYDAMLQLQRTVAQVEATLTYYNFANPAAAIVGRSLFGGAPTKEQWFASMDQLLQGKPGGLPAVLTEMAAKGGIPGIPGIPSERSSETTVFGAPIPLGMTAGEFLQRTRQAMIDINVFEVDFKRTMEQLQIAVDSATGNIGADPVLDKPHIWNSSSPRIFNISFPLYNVYSTDDSNWQKTIIKNWELCYLLTYQNLYNKRNLFKGIPPVFYAVEVPGVYYTKASYVSNLVILNVGNIRKLDLPVADNGTSMPVNVPDAYVVNMTLTDFFMPSRNFLDTINNNQRRIVVTKSG